MTLFIAGFISAISAQDNFKSQKPEFILNQEPGYITINEFTGGFGLGVTNVPYSKGFLGFTTLHGYQINKEFVVAAGTGINFYNEGILVPLFLDFRYRIHVARFTPYAFGDGGFLFDFSGKKNMRVFINPGIGVSYIINPKFAVNIGTGLFIQGGNLRDTYINLKTGVYYKF